MMNWINIAVSGHQRQFTLNPLFIHTPFTMELVSHIPMGPTSTNIHTKQCGLNVLPKDTTAGMEWDSNPQPLGLGSTTW